MSNTILAATLSTLEEVSSTYLELAPLEQARAQARNWRPHNGFWRRAQSLAGALPGVSSRKTHVDGHAMLYWEIGRGQGSPVILVHGFGASKENWISLIPGLLGQGHRILVVDLPGFGASTFDHEARYTYSDQARRLAQWSQQLGLEPAHWVGSSMGGAICATLAARHPEVVAAVTLMNAAGLGSEKLSPLEEELLKGENPLIPDHPAAVRRLFRMTTHRASALFGWLMSPALTREMLHRVPINHLLFADMLQPEIRVPELLERIQAPVQVLWGERDRIVDVSSARRYAALLPHARLDILPDIGHLPMLEAPLRSARLIRHFRAEQEIAAAPAHQV